MLWEKMEQGKGNGEFWQGEGRHCNLNGTAFEQRFEAGGQ